MEFVEPWWEAVVAVPWRAWVLFLGLLSISWTLLAASHLRRWQSPDEEAVADARHETAVRDLTLASIIIGIVLASVGYLQAQSQTLTNRTLDLISNISLDETLSASDFRMARWIKQGARFGGDVDEEVDRHIINLLDYYEFLGVAWEQGAVHEATLMIVRCGPMVRAWDVNERYIEDRRRTLGAPNLYRRYETLVVACRANGFGT